MSTVVWGNLAGRGNLAHFKNLNWEHCGGHVSIIKVQVDAEIFNFIIFLLQNKNWDFLHSYNILKIIFEKISLFAEMKSVLKPPEISESVNSNR